VSNATFLRCAESGVCLNNRSNTLDEQEGGDSMLSFNLPQRLRFPAAVFSVIVLGGFATTVTAKEFTRGQALYENHCQSCHADWAHTRSERKVTSMGELHQRVAAWSVHARLDWSVEDVGDVADYLEQNFYRFETKPE
jgi:mono/diheme cytochrome c family protein